MRQKVTKTIYHGMRFYPEVMRAIEQAAYDSHRTVSDWMTVACLWAIENKAIDTVPRPGDKNDIRTS